MTKIVAATYGSTESGDDLPILLWAYHPSVEDVNAKYKELLPAEFEDPNENGGGGYSPGCVNWSIEVHPEVVDR